MVELNVSSYGTESSNSSFGTDSSIIQYGIPNKEGIYNDTGWITDRIFIPHEGNISYLMDNYTDTSMSSKEFTTSSDLWTNVSANVTEGRRLPDPVGTVELILISIIVTILSILTIGGNLLVLIAFKIDKQLQTVSNSFLASLAVADLAIGLISMPLYTVYLLMRYWPLGPIICDIWLSLDYTMSNASVANLLIISCDRYLSVTRPLTYRAKRTPKRAGIMIACAWIISALMWPPWIIAWPYIEGERTVDVHQCAIQFLTSNEYITIITAVIAFYLPVCVMCALYFKIFRATQKRQKGLAKIDANRQIGYSSSRKKCISSDEDIHSNINSHSQGRPRSDSSDMENISVSMENINSGPYRHRSWWQTSCCRNCRIIDRDTDYVEESSTSDPQASDLTPVSTAFKTTSFTSSSRDHSSGGISALNGKYGNKKPSIPISVMEPLISSKSKEMPNSLSPAKKRNNLSSISEHEKEYRDSMYTILIKLPNDSSNPNSKPSIQMYSDTDTDDDVYQGERRLSEVRESNDMDNVSDEVMKNVRITSEVNTPEGSPIWKLREDFTPPTSNMSLISKSPYVKHVPRSKSYHNTANEIVSRQTPGHRSRSQDDGLVLPNLSRRLTETTEAIRTAVQAKFHVHTKVTHKVRSSRTKKKFKEKKQDQKAARTLSAILLAFVLTWTPYNLFTVIMVFCPLCVNDSLYAIGYWLCYINSTINPLCYALCNANFRRAFWKILTCKCNTKRQRPDFNQRFR